MREVIEAAQSRIRTPYFGYAVLAFFGLNWRGIFLLATTKGSPEERLAAFDSVTSALTLVILPLFVGALVSASAQWVKYGFSLISRKPLELLDNLDLEAEHRKTIRHTELEQSRSELFAVKEQELIQRAQRDEQVADIDDVEVKERLASQLEALRRERDHLTEQLESQIAFGQHRNVSLSNEARDLLEAAASDEDGIIMKAQSIGSRTIQAGGMAFGDGGARDFAKFEQALDDLVDAGLVKEMGVKGEVFSLTNEGWRVADAL